MSDFDRLFDELGQIREQGNQNHNETIQRLTRIETQYAQANKEIEEAKAAIATHETFQTQVKTGFRILYFINFGLLVSFIKKYLSL